MITSPLNNKIIAFISLILLSCIHITNSIWFRSPPALPRPINAGSSSLGLRAPQSWNNHTRDSTVALRYNQTISALLSESDNYDSENSLYEEYRGNGRSTVEEPFNLDSSRSDAGHDHDTHLDQLKNSHTNNIINSTIKYHESSGENHPSGDRQPKHGKPSKVSMIAATSTAGGNADQMTYMQTMIVGALSRTIAQTVMHPVNTYKTMLQINRSASDTPRRPLCR